jgi:hypothetical protein
MYAIGQEKDWMRLAACAVDLGVDDRAPRLYTGDEALTPRGGLARNLTEATDRLIAGLKQILEEAGIDAYGHEGYPPPS